MFAHLSAYRMILASNSPRRRELLAGLGLTFETRAIPGIDESYPDGLSGPEIAVYIASAKARAYRATLAADELLITSDTIVYIDGRVFGKPHDRDEACAMLRALSGRTHQVITGVTLQSREHLRSFSVTTEVTFAALAEEEIAYYVDHYRPFDKAGSYGIQEWIGFVGVTGIHGSYFNVMGLPVQRLYQELKTFPGLSDPEQNNKTK